jgi:hypothetical protein
MMSGEARSSEFLLSTATVMIGPRDKVMELTPELHSLGLAKNVQVTTEPQFVSLTQGVEAIEVASVNVSNPARISCEVYEYTARNLAYGAGIDASGADFNPITTQAALASPVADGGSTLTLATGSVAANGIVVGSFLTIQDTNVGDKVHVGKVGSISGEVITLASGYAMPTGMAFAVATTAVFRVRNIKVGSQLKRPLFGAKLVGTLPESGEPITLIFPKVRITRGLGLSFQNENFANMPFEFMPQALLPADAYYADFGGTKSFSVLKR